MLVYMDDTSLEGNEVRIITSIHAPELFVLTTITIDIDNTFSAE